MIIVKVIGGLGNQMFQIALGEALMEKGKDVKFDMLLLDDYLKNLSRGNVCDVFGLNLAVATRDQVLIYSDQSMLLLQRVRRKLIGRKKTCYREKQMGTFDREVFLLENVYLDGYWQTEKYFYDIKKKIYNMFSFPKLKSTASMKYEYIITHSKNPISVHIRLGDYLEKANQRLFGNICTSDYYEKAMEYCRKKYGECTFFVFSNGKPILKNVSNDIVFVETAETNEEWVDMYLMSLCKHNIIANSSFSWWGAWLNKNVDKEVIAPQKWINTEVTKDICPSEWKRI